MTSDPTLALKTGTGRARRSRGALMLVGFLSLGSMVGCTSSASLDDPVWSAPKPGEASVATAVMGVPKGEMLPQGFLDELAEATSLTITQVGVDLLPGGVEAADSETTLDDVDVLMGFGPNWFDQAPGAATDPHSVDLVDLSFISYGSDDACVLVDASWFSANNLALPMAVEQLPSGALETIVSSSDPRVSPYALAALPQWDDLWATWDVAPQSGQSQSGEQPQSGEGLGLGAVGKVGSALEPIRSPNNLGTDTRYRVLADTCVEREVVLVDLSARPERQRDDAAYVVLADFLVGNAGAQMLAKYGVAYPFGVEDGGQSESGLVRSEAKPPFSSKETAAALKMWEKTFG